MDMSPIPTMPPTIAADPGAREWEYLSHGAVVVERNRWFVAALVAGLIAAGAVTAIAMMLPLEKLVPLAVTVDSHTGLVTSVEYGKSVSDLTQKEAIQRSDVARYVIARETYDAQDYATHIKMVRVMSDGNVWQQYEDDNSQYTDASAVKRYGYKGRRRIEVNTALPLPDLSNAASNTYQVRFVAIEEFPGSQMLPVEKPYVATVSFRYSERALSNEDRIINPLNFRATAYRTDQEIGNPIASSNKGGQ